ncbi:hypothetical protein FN846DRAFT_145457 [Sphaerosporella brunnea]|uniref:Uncharacterized protein n=1 Tax=Sphaerosporella brunnea TaxID=1250544 RepID=A0A5J5EQ65_9PEZI|nr:hypothetical protein FN846DRAFT_145457 [Sphaerosporella brunnea]
MATWLFATPVRAGHCAAPTTLAPSIRTIGQRRSPARGFHRIRIATVLLLLQSEALDEVAATFFVLRNAQHRQDKSSLLPENRATWKHGLPSIAQSETKGQKKQKERHGKKEKKQEQKRRMCVIRNSVPARLRTSIGFAGQSALAYHVVHTYMWAPLERKRNGRRISFLQKASASRCARLREPGEHCTVHTQHPRNVGSRR